MTLVPGVKALHIIEDRDADFLALRRAIGLVMAQKRMAFSLCRHRSAEDAFQALVQGAKPDLMFIDLRLTGETGLSFLARVKTDARIFPCPKIILTSSTREKDVEECFREGAGGYLVKPLRHQELVRSVQSCLDYWFEVSRRPRSQRDSQASSC